MSDYNFEKEGMDMEAMQIARSQLTCVSCDESFSEDGNTEWHFIIDDVWCHQCVIDADLIGHTYG